MVSGITYKNGRYFIYSREGLNSKKSGILEGIYAMSDIAPENSF